MTLPDAPPIDPHIEYALAYLLQALANGGTPIAQKTYPIGVPAAVEPEQIDTQSVEPSGVEPTPIRKRSRKRRLPQTLNSDEMERLLKAPNLDSNSGLRDRVMLELMYRAGLRVGEVCALQPRDVDTTRGMVRIVAGKGDRDGTAYFDAESVSPLVERWKQRRRRIGLARSPFLFCTIRTSTTNLGGVTPAGQPVSPRQVQSMIKRRAIKAGVDPRKVTPHVLRHTYATQLLDEGFTIREVQEALRHANLATTEIYTHVLDLNLRRKISERKR